MNEKKSIILLEHEEQVKNYIERCEEIKGQKQVIALSPFAMHELDKHNIPYKIIEDYCDPEELYKLGTDNYQTVENLCDVIDKKIQNVCPDTLTLNITPARFGLFTLKMMYDAATIRLFQLFKLIDAEKPNSIFIYGSKKYPFGTSEMAPYLSFDNRESIYAHLLALAGWGVDVDVIVLPPVQYPENIYNQEERHQNISKKFKNRMIGWLQHHPKMFDLAMATRKRGWYGLFGMLKSYLHTGKLVPVLLFGGGNNWDDCIAELRSAGVSPLIRIQDDLAYWISDRFSNKRDSDVMIAAWEELKIDEDFHRFFVWDTVDFFPVVEERLRFTMEHWTFACLNAYEEAEEWLKKRGIKAVLGSTFSTCTGHSVSQAAKNLDVPVILWQHGTYGYFDWIMGIYNDIIPSDALFVFGEGTVEKCRTIAKRYSTQILPIGSSSLEKLYEGNNTKSKRYVKLSPNEKVIVYVTTTFYQNDFYISWPPVFSDNYFWQTQQSIMDALGKHNEYNVIVKTHPSHAYRETPLRSYANEKGFENCQFIRDECSFTDLLPLADVIIIDMPSTVLLQSLTTIKPIFALLKHLKVDDDAIDLLKRRTYCYFDLGKFTNDLDTFLSSGSIDTEADLNDRAFLKMYGTHLDDGKSGVRAAQALIKIINESNAGR